MSMFDTVEIAQGAPLPEEITDEEWQVHIENIGASFRVTEDMRFEKSTIRLKDDVELDEDEEPTSDQIEQAWVLADGEDDVEGKIMLTGSGGVQMPLRVENGRVTVFPQIRTLG